MLHTPINILNSCLYMYNRVYSMHDESNLLLQVTPSTPPSDHTPDDLQSQASNTSEHLRDNSPFPSHAQIPPSLLATPIGGKSSQQLQFTHILQKDCFLVFRALCKLSMKSVTDVYDARYVLYSNYRYCCPSMCWLLTHI